MTATVGGMLPRRHEAEAAKSAEMRSGSLGKGQRRTFATNEISDSRHFESPEPPISLSKKLHCYSKKHKNKASVFRRAYFLIIRIFRLYECVLSMNALL
jgi:hypothetical protein